MRPNDIISAILEVRRERNAADQKQIDDAEPETLEERLRREGSPWTVEQYETHERRIGRAIQLRLRGRSQDVILEWLRERKDFDQSTGKATPADVPDKLLVTEENTVASWFRS